MNTELVNITTQHYKKNEDGEFVLDTEEIIEVKKPVGEVMTPEERIAQLEAKLEALLNG
jgi:hypothetical protein